MQTTVALSPLGKWRSRVLRRASLRCIILGFSCLPVRLFLYGDESWSWLSIVEFASFAAAGICLAVEVYTAELDALHPIQLVGLPDGLRQDESWRNTPEEALPPVIWHIKEEVRRLESYLVDIYIEDERLRRADEQHNAYWTSGHRIARFLLSWAFPFHEVAAGKEHAKALRYGLTRFHASGTADALIRELNTERRRCQERRTAMAGSALRIIRNRRIRQFDDRIHMMTDNITDLQNLEARQAATAAAAASTESDDPVWESFTKKATYTEQGPNVEADKRMHAYRDRMQLRKEHKAKLEKEYKDGVWTDEEYKQLLRQADEVFGEEDPDAPFKRRR